MNVILLILIARAIKGIDTVSQTMAEAMWIDKTKQRVPFSELLKVPGPAPKSPEESLRAPHSSPCPQTCSTIRKRFAD